MADTVGQDGDQDELRPQADLLHLGFRSTDARYDRADEILPGIFLEFDAHGTPIGFEVIGVSKRATAQGTVEFVT